MVAVRTSSLSFEAVCVICGVIIVGRDADCCLGIDEVDVTSGGGGIGLVDGTGDG